MCKTFAMIILAGAVAFAVVPYAGHAAAHEDQGQGGTIHGGVEAKTKRHTLINCRPFPPPPPPAPPPPLPPPPPL